MYFSKMHGLGNDFMVIDGVTQNIYLSNEQIKTLADRNLGVGFDQLLIVEPPFDPDMDFHYRIFNADGSEVGQCGNGARCFARFVKIKGLTHKTQINVSTQKGKIVLQLCKNNEVCVNMDEPIFTPNKVPFIANKVEKNYLLTTPNKTFLCGVVSMGNPHCVLNISDAFPNKDLYALEIDEVGAILENHERFPERANISFMQIIDRNNINLRVFERGVGETKACGTGACASVAVGINQGLLDTKVTVNLLGGSLNIEWNGAGKPLFMSGQATHVYDGFIKI